MSICKELFNQGKAGTLLRLPARSAVKCRAKAKKAASNTPPAKGFGSSPTRVAAPPQRLTIQLLEDLPAVPIDPDSGINSKTLNTCLFFQNQTEELCGRLPKALDQAWALATAARINDCISRPLTLESGGHTTSVHVLEVSHDDAVNPALLNAVWDRVRPEAVALDVPPPYTKSFTRMAKVLDERTAAKLLDTPLASLSAALDHADDFDRLRWHHALLEVAGAGRSPLALTENDLVNAFAARNLYLSEVVAAALLAARAGAPVHGIDLEDRKAAAVLAADDVCSDADVEAYRTRLLSAADPVLRSAAKTWLAGVPAGTASTQPRTTFILSRLEQSLPRPAEAAFLAADAAWRAAHPEPRVRQQQELRSQQAAHMLGQLRLIGAGRIGGRKCGRVLAVVDGAVAAAVRAEAEKEAAAGAGAGAQ